MIEKGLGEEEIKSNLRELGIQDVDAIYSSAVAQSESAAETSGMSQNSVEQLRQEGLDQSEGLEKKLEEISAQVKALNEINQKILDTNRQILLRLK